MLKNANSHSRISEVLPTIIVMLLRSIYQGFDVFGTCNTDQILLLHFCTLVVKSKLCKNRQNLLVGTYTDFKRYYKYNM